MLLNCTKNASKPQGNIDIAFYSEHYQIKAYIFMSTENLSTDRTDLPPILFRYARNEVEKLLRSDVFKGIDVPHGDGQHVVVIPGLSESDKELRFITEFLTTLGYIPESSGIGFNIGHPWQHEVVRKKIHDLVGKFGKVSIVGHSLGGLTGAIIAQVEPNVEKVITLGSPLLNGIRASGTTFMESVVSPIDHLVPNAISQFKGPHTRNVVVSNPNHFELLCHAETYNEIGNALAS
jgi:hypothetical protein